MRKPKTILLYDNGRPLRFVVRQMPALQMEAWLERAAELLPLPRLGGAPAHPVGVAGLLLRRGIFALARAGGEQPAALLEEMLQRCCSLVDGENGAETPCSSEIINSRISDVRTLLRLRWAALRENLIFACEGARKPLSLPKEHAFRRSSEGRHYARTVNVPQVAGFLIGQGMASLNELRTGYSFSEALDLLEIINVRNYNQWEAHEAARQKR